MREAIGGSWLFQIVIAFVLLFTGYMCLTINSSKAFNVKNEIIKAIEREGGVDLENSNDDPAIQKIATYLKKISYRTEGKCPDSIPDSNDNRITYHGFNRDGGIDDRNPAFCIAKVDPNSANSDDLPDMSYYRVIVFYQLDLPIFNQMFNFKVTGDTRKLNTSYNREIYRRTTSSMCQEYRFGKKIGPEKPCYTIPDDQIIN